ncbi:MAG TPA: hypothetical protein VH518_02080 [Tepidisphaeraceae bacterium]|jgi:hypothetical protein
MSFFTRILLICVIAGGFLLWFGLKEWRLSQAASVTPQKISCAELEKSGPGSNAHIILTDYVLSPSGFVYQGTKNSDATWSIIWIPAVPSDGEYVKQVLKLVQAGEKDVDKLPVPKNIKLIVKTRTVHNETELDQFRDRETIEGLIVNKVEALGSQERNLLASSYPGIDFSTCYILEEGRKPKSAGASAGMMGGGGGLVLLGALGFVRAAKKS